MNNKINIPVFGQFEPISIDPEQKVEINKYLEVYKAAKDLKEDDSFLFNGYWYLAKEVK